MDDYTDDCRSRKGRSIERIVQRKEHMSKSEKGEIIFATFSFPVQFFLHLWIRIDPMSTNVLKVDAQSFLVPILVSSYFLKSRFSRSPTTSTSTSVCGSMVP